MDNTMLDHLIWDEYDRQMKVMDEQESEPGIERYPEIRFKREYLVFKPAHFTAGRIFTLGEKTQLPNNSILHVLDNQAHLNEAPVDVPRLEEHPLIDRESFRKFVYHIRNFNLEGPLHYEDKYIYRQSGLPANLLKFRAQHGSRFRYVNLIGELPPRREALCIINHNPLFRARFFGRLQTYRKLTLIWTSILNTVCSLDHMHKNQFIEIPWGPNVYMKNLFVMNRDKLTIATIKRPEDPQYFLMMHLVNFMWDTATTSIFKQLPEEILPQINLILNFGDRYLFYNLAELKQLNQPKNKVYFKFINQLNMLSLTGQMDLETTSSNVVKQVKQIVKETRVPSTDDENGETVTVVEPINTAPEQEEIATSTEVPHEDTVVEKLIAKTVEVIRQTPQVNNTKPAPHIIQGITKSPAPSISKKDLKTLTETKKLKETVAKDKARPAVSTTPMKEIVKTYMDEGDKEALEFINQNETLTLPQRKRYERLATKYKELTLGDKTLEQVLEEDNDITLEPEVIDEKKVGELPDKSALTSSVVTFDHTYMKKSFNKHLVETLTSFRKQGVYLTDLKVVHENDRMNNFVHYTCKYEDINGKSSTIKFRLPQLMNDGRIRIDGNYQVLKKQRINLPIVKISDTEVSLASNYNKTRVERNTNKSHNYFSFIDSFLNSEKSTAQIEFGNCSINLPLAYDYTSLAPRYRRVTFRKNSDTFDLWFDYKDRESHFDGKPEQMFALESQYGTYFGHNSESWLFIDNSNTVSAVNKHGGEQIDWRYTSLLSVLAESLKEGETYKKNFTEYTTIKILDKMLPIIFLLGYQYGLRRTLDYLGIKYTITEAKNRTIVGTESIGGASVATLNKICNSLKNVEYGMYDKKINGKMDDDKWDDHEYMLWNTRILTPAEVLKYKVGTCWDQSLYIAHECEKYGIDWKYLSYESVNADGEYSTHTTVLAKLHGKVYWLEHAWGNYQGVHEYASMQDCIQDIVKKNDEFQATRIKNKSSRYASAMLNMVFVEKAIVRKMWTDRDLTQDKFIYLTENIFMTIEFNKHGEITQADIKSPTHAVITFADGYKHAYGIDVYERASLVGTESFDVDISKIDDNAIASNEGLLMKWLEFNMWIYRKLYSTWAKLNKYDDVVFVWCNGKVNPKKNTFVFNSASIAYWDPKLTKPMRILQKLYEVEDKEYRIVVPKRLPIIKTWKGNFLYINDILKLLPDFARDVKKYAKIDKEYKTLFDKNMYAFFWMVHKSLIDYLKSRGCELYVDKTIKEKEDVHGNKYREGSEAFEYMIDASDSADQPLSTERRYHPQIGDIAIRFSDRTLWFNRYPLTQSLIVAGLDYFDCSQYSLADLESKDIYYQMLTDKGLSTNYLKGISSFFDLFVDGMTYEVLKSMNEPTNVRDLLIRSTEMLTTTDYLPPASRENHRLRGAEQINALIYNEMSRNFAAYQARRGKANTFSINPDAIFLRFISNASLVTSEASNPIQCMKESTYMTYAGAGGRSADSFVVRDRRFTDDDIGIISEATVDNQKVAINAQLSQNSGVVDITGKLQPKPIEQLQPADVLSNAALLFPFSVNDDKVFVRI